MSEEIDEVLDDLLVDKSLAWDEYQKHPTDATWKLYEEACKIVDNYLERKND